MPHGKKADEACLEAERTYAEAWARLEEARDRFKKKYGREEPDAFSKALREGFAKQGFEKFSKAACDSHQTVDRLIDAMYSARGTNMQETRARLHEELDRQTAAYNATVKPLDDANNDAYERFDNLFQTLVDTQPTTLSGLSALFACPVTIRCFGSKSGRRTTITYTNSSRHSAPRRPSSPRPNLTPAEHSA